MQITQRVYVAEDQVKSARSEVRAAFDARSEVEIELGALKENHSKLAEQLKEAVRAKDSAEAGLKTTEKQFEDIRKQLHYNEINLVIEKQLVTELREELQKAREAAQLIKEVAETEKQAAYTLGVEETQAKLTEEFSVVCRDYCDISWGKVLDVAGVPVDFDLRRPKSIYYDLEIRELSGPDSSHSGQPTQVSVQPKADQVPSAPLEVPKDSNQDDGKGKEIETLKGKDKGQDKKKNSSNPTKKASNTAVSQPDQIVDLGVPKTRAQARGFLLFLYVFCCFFLKKCITPFLLSVKTSFFCFIRHDMCYKIHRQRMATFCHFNLNKIYYHIL